MAIYLDAARSSDGDGSSWSTAYKYYDTAYSNITTGTVLNIKNGDYTTTHASIFPGVNFTITPSVASGTVVKITKV